MTFLGGRKPEYIAIVTMLLSFAAQAQHNIPLTLAEAENLALDQEPGHAALLARASAFDDHAIAAGQLPVPTMSMGLANYPISSGGFSTEGMTMAQL